MFKSRTCRVHDRCCFLRLVNHGLCPAGRCAISSFFSQRAHCAILRIRSHVTHIEFLNFSMGNKDKVLQTKTRMSVIVTECLKIVYQSNGNGERKISPLCTQVRVINSLLSSDDSQAPLLSGITRELRLAVPTERN